MNTRESLRQSHFETSRRHLQRDTNQLFFWLLLAQWIFAVALALIVSPHAWEGRARSLHIHVQAAVLLGGLINSLPLYLIRYRPDWWLTPHAVAAVQMLWSGLLIHLTGGRIETHFHVFGSLAFLAFYRNWRVILTGTGVIVVDHLLRGLFWPESVYGLANPEWWRLIVHAAWMCFEDFVLILAAARSLAEMNAAADREARLQLLNVNIERRVEERTAELSLAKDSLEHEMRTRLHAEAELRQAQKLEAVGRLASGVAHEINTPVQFVSDSIQFLREAVQDLLRIVVASRVNRRAALKGGSLAEAVAATEEIEKNADLEFLLEKVPKAFDRSVDGLERVTTIVRSLNEFAHPDSAEMTTVDLNRAIQSTLTIARNEYKYVAEVETAFGEVPPLVCHAGEINQVVLNILINAAHAIGDVVKGTGGKGLIRVSTSFEDGAIIVSIADSGGGIHEDVRDRIFDPFFTTKEVGKGTGQGLTIARSVVEKHGGELTLTTEAGKGTTFFIRLPLSTPKEQEAA
ncbi:MAG TPA: ATP-binding protein [Myxococcales bacterium]|nr:ATP-binding protein [Myxococcales bacterium]